MSIVLRPASSTLGQTFYDQLPSSSSLVFLKINDQGTTNFNFDFLSNLTRLEHLMLYIYNKTKWPIDSIYQAIKNLKFFSCLDIATMYPLRIHFNVYTKVASSFVDGQKVFEGNLKELVQYLKKIENKVCNLES